MSPLEITIRIAAGLFLTLVNAFFVVTEFALTRLRQLDKSEFQDHSHLRLAWKMTERLEIYLTSCQLGITSSSILMGVIAEPGVSFVLEPLILLIGVPPGSVPVISIISAVVLINLVHKIWGEQAPTYLGVERPKEVVRWAAPIHYWWTLLMYPIIIAGDGLAKGTLRLIGVKIQRSWVSEVEGDQSDSKKVGYAELRRTMGEVLSRGSLTKDRKKEVLRALEIETIPVQTIMTPRNEIIAASTTKTFEENLQLMADKRRFARIPLIGNSLEEFLGVLYIADVLHHLEALRSGSLSLADLATTPMTVSADLPVSKLIDWFQTNKQELALVEENGKVVGLVTITEALEAIAGEVEDPFDQELLNT